MPDFTKENQLWLFLAFFLPGFISLKVYDLFIPTDKRDFSKILGEVVGYSALNYMALLPLYLALNSFQFPQQHPVWFTRLFWTLVIFAGLVMPIAWPLLWLWLSRQDFLSQWIVSPFRPWDAVFSTSPHYYVVVTMKDGKQYAGLYGVPDDLPTDAIPPNVSSYPAPPQIYLKRTIRLNPDGTFAGWVPDSRGMLILGEIQLVEFFWPDNPPPKEIQECPTQETIVDASMRAGTEDKRAGMEDGDQVDSNEDTPVTPPQ